MMINTYKITGYILIHKNTTLFILKNEYFPSKYYMALLRGQIKCVVNL